MRVKASTSVIKIPVINHTTLILRGISKNFF